MKVESVIKVWKEMEREGLSPSTRTVSERLASMGIVSPRTGNPYTAQAIRNLFSKTPEGQVLLSSNSTHNDQPIIVNTDPMATQWLRNHLTNAIIVQPNNPKLFEIVTGRTVYGNVTMEVAIRAHRVMLPRSRGSIYEILQVNCKRAN
mgnify:CR=1 FL=1